MMGGMNPWLSMWTQPRHTIRAIIQTNPKYGVLYLAAIYSLQNFFYFSNYWSLGLSTSFFAILITGIVLCPFIGMIWLYFAGWILYFTGRWLEGKAPMRQLRTALAWSKIPTAIGLLMWFILLLAYPEYVFILDSGGPSSIFINFITSILCIWSFVLLIQSIREVQYFSVGRAIINVLLSLIVTWVFSFILFALIRYFYLLTV